MSFPAGRPVNTGQMLNAYDPSKAQDIPAADRELIARREKALGAAYRLFYQQPLHPVRGEGCYLWDAEGKRYLDAYNNVASVGHAHPRVTEALTRQAGLLNTHTRYLHPLVVEYAERLLALAPKGLGNVMLTCTGSEANDLAIRIARNVTGGQGVIVTRNAYHGVTDLLAGMSPSLGNGVPKGRDVWLVDAPDPYSADPAAGFAAGVAGALAQMQAEGVRPAALLIDTIFASDGIFPDPAGFIAPAVELVRAAGGVFIADEVQPGFGRCGVMWGCVRHGVDPDILTMGKPMGNGHPVAGLMARADLVAEFGKNIRYFNTYGGNPVSAAVGLAVLDVMRDEKLVANSADTGGYLATGLQGLAKSDSRLGKIRAAGLYVGVDLLDAQGAPDAVLASGVVNALRRKGVLISASGPAGHVLKIRPPLPFGRAEADMLVDGLAQVLEET